MWAATAVLMSALAVPIIVLTVIGNLLVLCFKARVGRTNTTLLVWNLGLTDFLVGVFVLPLGAINLVARRWLFGRWLCRVWVATDITLCTSSVVTICTISVDRYLAVTRPLRYRSLVTKTRAVVVILVIWVFSVSVLLLTLRWDRTSLSSSSPSKSAQADADNETTDDDDDTVCFAGNEIRYLAHSVIFAFFLPAAVTLTFYWRIYRLAKTRQQALDRGFLLILGHNMNFLSNTISHNVGSALRVHQGRTTGMVEHQRRVLRTHERVAKTLGVVSCSFLICWLPFFTLYLLNFRCDGCISTAAIDIASWLGYCNSMLNPIIYSFTVRQFKRSVASAGTLVWRGAARIVPCLLPPPPERLAQRARWARVQQLQEQTKLRIPRTKSCDLGVSNGTTDLSREQSHRLRRLTEPAMTAAETVDGVASDLHHALCTPSQLQSTAIAEVDEEHSPSRVLPIRADIIKVKTIRGGSERRSPLPLTLHRSRSFDDASSIANV